MTLPCFTTRMLPTLDQQAAEDCGNPWNRRDQGCRQGATGMLECGASEEIRAASPSQAVNRNAASRVERGGGGGLAWQSEEGDTNKQGRLHACEWGDRNTTP
ncbi:hypothetical protein AMECASPLE_014302 [Ameca splendens]|uniref:Uncharacterized protein n=1 Tax=Ameca splendens TaxID=208324 RepID=A0ABV0YCI7_9TELE